MAIRLRRHAFDTILAEAVPSTYVSELYAISKDWQKALKASKVRLQWDLAHNPSGAKIERRAIQLRLGGPLLKRYAQDWIIDIEDISDFVRQQQQHALTGNYAQLVTPQEREYPISYRNIGAN